MTKEKSKEGSKVQTNIGIINLIINTEKSSQSNIAYTLP